MIKISHELPLSLIPELDKHNDYDFILPRFWKQSEEYRNFYRKSNKFSILDNGLFEGDSFQTEELVQIIREVKPNIFIIPDVWNDWQKTCNNAFFWMKHLKQKDVEFMVVLQGNYTYELKHMYKLCKDIGYKHFAFNHSSNSYTNKSHFDEIIDKMFGRIRTIHHFYFKNVIEEDHYIHLLGCYLPQELMYYKDIKIDSIDTTNPIINGILDIEYEIGGLLSKPVQKLEEFFDKDFLGKIDLITSNIQKFKKFCNGEKNT